ncbi:hypothetical protein J2S49_001521 [Arcanobacterium wilhelmae]|uniref:DUF3017 domain-containing protein n=1 Tax=Arcanobacterium wilhelmae TaxID=1803177 RepID=A0ABT9NCK4_9ACTO|nr:DUF3017 domain-containing protein [Arcanobacterium wilhelmae]MDP9801445.1 hypothetical protein [Arcanobacterium wilhelmae]WFN90779.1 DUF3017 domain-containing protein [Arcanobacterium wilhelmae]
MNNYQLPPLGYYVVLIAWLVVAIGTAFLVNVGWAADVLATGFVAHALARVILPAGTVPQVRSKLVDVAWCLAFAGAITFFASFGNTPQL